MATILLLALIQGLLFTTLAITFIDKWHLDNFLYNELGWNVCLFCSSFWSSFIATSILVAWHDLPLECFAVPFLVPAVFNFLYK